jgi:hypothetical protein
MRGEEDSVLRISSEDEMGPVVRLKAEGTIRGDWVPLLEGECLCHLGSHRMVELDVTGIGFVDREGAAMVRSLVDKGVRLVGESALFEALLQRTAT